MDHIPSALLISYKFYPNLNQLPDPFLFLKPSTLYPSPSHTHTTTFTQKRTNPIPKFAAQISHFLPQIRTICVPSMSQKTRGAFGGSHGVLLSFTENADEILRLESTPKRFWNSRLSSLKFCGCSTRKRWNHLHRARFSVRCPEPDFGLYNNLEFSLVRICSKSFILLFDFRNLSPLLRPENGTNKDKPTAAPKVLKIGSFGLKSPIN
ncbi:hypothetical protein H5410_012314 [Solanum commersonii]|uniref:Uncharacterized protein n=1 Tax=Solanum commersonii TaxID=4109 RepID=A0A9J6AR37_SOLCO|nr:hypothetical protein H5410_012314 [Solanum commersonii]